MTHADYENPPTYPGMLIGGWTASAVGGVTLPMILTAGFTSDRVIPSGIVGLAVALAVVGAILLAARSVKQDLAQHRADHQTARLSVEDVDRINTRLDSLDKRTADTQELLAHTSVCSAAPPAALDATNGERRAYANGAVDMLDGHAAVIPMNGGPGLRIVPVQDPRRSL